MDEECDAREAGLIFFSIGNRIVGARDSFEYQSLSYFPVEKFSRL